MVWSYAIVLNSALWVDDVIGGPANVRGQSTVITVTADSQEGTVHAHGRREVSQFHAGEKDDTFGFRRQHVVIRLAVRSDAWQAVRFLFFVLGRTP